MAFDHGGTALELSSANADLGGSSERRLRAMVHADVAGYSRLIGMNDAGTVRRLRTLRRALIDPAIRAFSGRIVNTAGDSMMIMFESVDAAVQCAVRVQQGIPILDGDQPPERRIRFRVGINIGDVITDRNDVHGDGCNVAARLQSICPIGGICVSRAVRDHVHPRFGIQFEALGPQTLKNIAKPVEAFILRLNIAALTEASVAHRGTRKLVLVGVVALLLATGSAMAWWLRHDAPRTLFEALRRPANIGVSQAPRLSIVVLPFDNLDNEQNSPVDSITEDLTTSLAQEVGLVVTARNSAFSSKGAGTDIRRIGSDLGVRYALEGSVRKIGTSLRVNAQLISAETGAHLWADQIDADTAADDFRQDEIIGRISTEAYRHLIQAESARGARERPGNPNATDILLQASALYDRIWNAQQLPAVTALYERAVQIDPSFVEALAGLARTLLDSIGGLDDPTAPVLLERVEGLVAKAESLQPERLSVIYARGFLLQLQEHRPEAIAAFQNLIDRYPNSSVGYHMLGTNLLFVGRAADTVSMEQRSIRIDPQNPYIWQRYRRIGQASLLLGRYDVAVTWLQRALAALPSGNGSTATRAFRYAEIAAALALAGRVDEAHSAAAEANRLLPTITVREWTTNITNPVFGSQVARVLQGMRTAGVRDHADEDADFGVVSDDALHMNDYAQTPTTAPGVQTVRTTELAALLEHSKPLVLDVSGLGKSIPGAIGLRGAGIGGNTSDPFQARLARKVQALTHGDRTMPVVTMAWNADRFSGRNVALRLAALSYTNVMWYRGGREAWEVAGLPQTEVATQDW